MMKSINYLARVLLVGFAFLAITPVYPMDIKGSQEKTGAVTVAAAQDMVITKDLSNLKPAELEYLILQLLSFEAAYKRYEYYKQADESKKDSMSHERKAMSAYNIQHALFCVLKFFRLRGFLDKELDDSFKVLFKKYKNLSHLRDPLNYAMSKIPQLIRTPIMNERLMRAEKDSLWDELIAHIRINNVDMVKKLIEDPRYVKTLHDSHAIGYKPLFFAVYHNHFEMVQLLLTNSIVSDYLNHDGLHADMVLDVDSNNKNRAKIVTLLRNKGMSPSMKNGDGLTPLMALIKTKNLESANAMIGEAVSSNNLHDNQGRTAYYYAFLACKECDHVGHEHCCPWLAVQEKLKGCLNELDSSDGKTALMVAAQAGNDDMVQWLLAQGADVKRVSSDKMGTAYNMAKSERIKSLLESKGARKFEDEHNALLEKKRQEIKLKLEASKLKLGAGKCHESDRDCKSVQDDAMINSNVIKDVLKHGALVGHAMKLYKETKKQESSDPLVVQCFRDLLERSLHRYLYVLKRYEIDIHTTVKANRDSFKMLNEVVNALGFTKTMGAFGEKETIDFLVNLYDKSLVGMSPEQIRLDDALDELIFESIRRVHGNMDIKKELSLIKEQASINESGLDPVLLSQRFADVFNGSGISIDVLIKRLAESGADSSGSSALHYAILIGDENSIERLMRAGVLLGYKNRHDLNALNLIVRMGNDNLLRDFLGWAMQAGSPRAVNLLLNARAPGAKGPLDHARDLQDSSEREEILIVLKSFGAQEGAVSSYSLKPDAKKMLSCTDAQKLDALITTYLKALFVSGKASAASENFALFQEGLELSTQSLKDFFNVRGINNGNDPRIVGCLKQINKEGMAPTVAVLIDARHQDQKKLNESVCVASGQSKQHDAALHNTKKKTNARRLRIEQQELRKAKDSLAKQAHEARKQEKKLRMQQIIKEQELERKRQQDLEAKVRADQEKMQQEKDARIALKRAARLKRKQQQEKEKKHEEEQRKRDEQIKLERQRRIAERLVHFRDKFTAKIDRETASDAWKNWQAFANNKRHEEDNKKILEERQRQQELSELKEYQAWAKNRMSLPLTQTEKAILAQEERRKEQLQRRKSALLAAQARPLKKLNPLAPEFSPKNK